MRQTVFDVKIGGEYACFSRPEFKVERVSYLTITPSAARGALEAIFWKPEFRWEVRELWLLKPIRQTSVLRNELSSRQGDKPFFVEDPDRRQQRASLILKDVEYLVRAEMVLQPRAEAPVTKYVEQFSRRLEHGQCYHRPYLGTREFAAWFEAARGDEVAIPLDLDMGQVLFDLAYCENAGRAELEFHRHGEAGRRIAKGNAQALFFHAELRNGKLEVPSDAYAELHQLERQNA